MLDNWIDVRKKQIKEAVDPKITINKIGELNAYFTVKEINNVDYTQVKKSKNKIILYLSKGYKVLEYTPLDKFCNARIYVNDENEIYQYYFDIIDEVKIENEIPFYNDLYLDVVYDNDEKVKEKMHIAKNESTLRMIDEDELKDALKKV